MYRKFFLAQKKKKNLGYLVHILPQLCCAERMVRYRLLEHYCQKMLTQVVVETNLKCWTKILLSISIIVVILVGLCEIISYCCKYDDKVS